MTAAIRSIFGGPLGLRTLATSRKYSGPSQAGGNHTKPARVDTSEVFD